MDTSAYTIWPPERFLDLEPDAARLFLDRFDAFNDAVVELIQIVPSPIVPPPDVAAPGLIRDRVTAWIQFRCFDGTSVSGWSRVQLRIVVAAAGRIMFDRNTSWVLSSGATLEWVGGIWRLDLDPEPNIPGASDLSIECVRIAWGSSPM